MSKIVGLSLVCDTKMTLADELIGHVDNILEQDANGSLTKDSLLDALRLIKDIVRQDAINTCLNSELVNHSISTNTTKCFLSDIQDYILRYWTEGDDGHNMALRNDLSPPTADEFYDDDNDSGEMVATYLQNSRDFPSVVYQVAGALYVQLSNNR